MNGKLTLALGLFVLLVVNGEAISGAQSQAGVTSASSNEAGPKKAEEQYKNIQVLKGMPANQLIPAMQFITTSLGVECEFCHVQGAFEKDDKKPKQTARKMMEMMFAINKDNFEGHREVTCYSCHRGGTDPIGMPPVMAADAKPVMTEPEPPQKTDQKETGPTADQLFDKYLQAVGGAVAVDKTSSRVMKGTITFGDRNVPIDIYSKGPDKRISFSHMPDGDSVTAFNGHEGWLGFPGRPTRVMHGPDIDGASIDADLHFAMHLKSMFIKTEVRGPEKIGDQDAYRIVGTRQGKPPLRLYFDEHSGLLLRLVRYAESPLGELPTQIDYADYRDASGVKIPFRWTLARPSGRFTIQVNEVKVNVPVDDAKFVKPAEPAAEQKPPAK
ncbi:MAG: c-type cytochrome [Candidatus Sulfotelmatobacter sp.]